MAKNTTGSVAPKERINISYRPANGTTTERVELPFKMMVLGKFSTEDNASPLADRSPININKANFDEVIENLGVTLNFSMVSPPCRSAHTRRNLFILIRGVS